MYSIILKTYHDLLKLYGKQGWWPLTESNGYHPGNYAFSKTPNQSFEICIGAILTQNTNWKSVEVAISNLNHQQSLTPASLLALETSHLKEAIRPTGYFNQKSLYLQTFADFFLAMKEQIPSRDELLALRGIGEETADSMLLYAFKQPFFIVDSYTRRLFSDLGIVEMKECYSSIQKKFHAVLEPELSGFKRIQVYQEYHALIVQHAKLHFSGKLKGHL